MKKIRVVEKRKELNIYEFYCDKCNKYIGSSEEYSDGYYVKLGEVEEKAYIYHNWYRLNKTLCEDCKNEFYENLITKLIQIGFKKDDD